MNLYEWQSKKMLADAGVPVPKGIIVQTGKEAGRAFKALELKRGVVKAQILSGGRGTSGGIRFVGSAEEAEEEADRMLESPLITPQTGGERMAVKSVLIEEALDVTKEIYLAITADRSIGIPSLFYSSEGGKEIEKIVMKSPEKVFKESLDPYSGITPETAEGIAKRLGFDGKRRGEMAGLVMKLGKAFFCNDALLLEVNPLGLADRLIALDAKIIIDDNALFRHPELSSLVRVDEDPLEREAREAGITYIRMDGEVGCLVNGAGLAMATMDIIKLFGGRPANFLDIGGGAHHEQVSAALRILFSKSNVKVVFVNIFGGMIHCDMIASRIVEAVREQKPSIPIVVRLEGTNAEEGRRILADSGLSLLTVMDMENGAKEAVKIASRNICPSL